MGFSLGFEQQETSESESILPRVPINLIAKWAREETEGRPLQAEVAVIPEALKARIITKGEASSYYAAMPLQNDSWRHLVAKEEFRLIGEPLSEQHLFSITEGTDALLKICGVDAVFDLWVSGDYSAASLEISQSTSAQGG